MVIDIRDDGVDSKSRMKYFHACNFRAFIIVLVVTDNLSKVQLDPEPDMRGIIAPKMTSPPT
jgi:hypothetical protein